MNTPISMFLGCLTLSWVGFVPNGYALEKRTWGNRQRVAKVLKELGKTRHNLRTPKRDGTLLNSPQGAPMPTDLTDLDRIKWMNKHDWAYSYGGGTYRPADLRLEQPPWLRDDEASAFIDKAMGAKV